MPNWSPELRARLAGLRLSPSREAEIIEELSNHLDDRYEELRSGGAAEADARRLALADLSEEDLLRRAMAPLRQASVPEPIAPGVGSRRLLGDLWQDVRYGARMLRKLPGFTSAAVLTLALGIGANTAIFSLINATLFQRLPVRDSSSLVYVFNGASGSNVFAYPEFAELRQRNDCLDGLLAYGGVTASLNADGVTDQVGGVIVTGNYFDVLGVGAAQGRVLNVQDDVTPDAHPVAVISHGLWQRRFAGRSDIVGHSIRLNGRMFTVVGVLPRAFAGAQLGVNRDLYVPMMMQALIRPPRAGFSGDMSADLLKVRTNRWLFALGRLRAGISQTQAQAALTAIATTAAQALDAQAPASPISLVPVDEGMPGQRAQMVPVARLLAFVVGAVLLIACANVANLLLSRATARRREIALRLALGASRWRLIRQLLSESVLLAVTGGALGVLLSWALVAAFRAAPPPAGALPIALDFNLDWRVLLFALGLSIATGVVFGLAPAVRASRPGLVPALKDESFVPDERARRFNLRKALVIGEVAVSLALLVAAGLFVRSLRETQAVSPGFDVDRLLSAPLNINLLRYTREQGREFYRHVTERLEALPGVEAASVARVAPLTGAARILSLQIQGRAGSNNQLQSEGGGMRADGRDTVMANVVGPGYFRTLGIPLVGGRDFGTDDAPESPRVVIVSREFTRLHFPGTQALGQRVSVNGPNGPWREIVGVAADSKYASLNEVPAVVVYLPLSQNHETGMILYVRAAGDPGGFVTLVRREIQSLESNLPVPAIQVVTETIATSLYAARMGALLLTVFGGLALLLAAIGVYGVLAFSISRRTRELGIRMALGAERSDVFTLVIKEGMALVLLGVAIGLAGAAFGTRSLSAFLYGVGTGDALTFASVPVILALVALIACVLPARRATKVDPTEALRYN